MIKLFRVYGRPGHRQRASFGNTYAFMTYRDGDQLLVNVICADNTGTNEYCDLVIVGKNEQIIDVEFMGQLSDGIFENCETGTIQSFIMKEVIYG